ncbi:MAG: hypothetical protein JNK75_03680 [Betaproteobacteria bacterium]|nr:hypothetical protein [Betaproteobacteria bacterium]
MSKAILLTVAGVAAIVGGVWYVLRPPNETAVLAAAQATAASSMAQTVPGARAGSSVGTLSPPADRPSARPAASAAPRPIVPLKSVLAQEFEKARAYKPFYDRYAANPDGADAETRYFAAVAMERCIGRAKGTSQETLGAQQQRFAARLKENDPNNAARIEAFNRTYELCEGFGNVAISGADVQRMYREAAAQGNPAAKIAVAATQYQEQLGRARGIEERRLSEEQLGTMREALTSGDPFAIERVGQLLAQSTQLAERRIGPNGDPYNPRDWGPAWQLAACDRGANCGADAQRVLNGCAWQGACGYDSLETYMQFNELPPNVYQAALNNRNMILEAIAQGRWDWLGIAQGMGRTVNPGTAMQQQQANRPPATPATTPPRKGG